MKFAEKLYWAVKEKQKEGYHFESIWLCPQTYRLLERQFKELEMGEISESGDMPITKPTWKKSKEYQARNKKERHFEGIKALDLITTLRTLIKIVPEGTSDGMGGPVVKEGNFLLRCVYVGTPEQREAAIKKAKNINIKLENEMKEDIARKVA